MTCGIYRIEHTDTGRAYIGRSSDVESRLKEHHKLLRHGDHENRALQEAWKKHGESAFEFAVVEECSPDKAEQRESYYICQFNKRIAGTFNKSKSGGGVPSSERKQTTVYLDADVKRRLKAYCELEDCEMSQFVNDLVAGELKTWTPEL